MLLSLDTFRTWALIDQWSIFQFTFASTVKIVSLEKLVDAQPILIY